MILTSFSKLVKKTKTKKYISLLSVWLKKRISKPAKSNIDKIIQKECFFGINKCGDFIIIPKTETGRKMTKSLLSYVESLENQDISRFLHEQKKLK